MKDPYDNTQTRFERTDRTGRWSPIEDDIPEPLWMAVLGGAAFGVVLAIMVYLSI